MNTDFLSNKKLRNILLITFFLVLFFWKTEIFIKTIQDVFALLSPFIIAGTIAFILNVPMRFIENTLFNSRKRKVPRTISRPISLVLAILFCAFIVAFTILVVVPQVQDTLANLVVELETFLPKARDYIIVLFNNNPEIEEFLNSINFDEIKNSVVDFLRTGIVNVFDSTISVATGAISIITKLFVAIVFSLYILIQKETLCRQFKKIIYAYLEPEKSKNSIRIFSMIENAFSKFITGQCLEAIILGGLIVLTLSIFQIPFAVLIGVVVGFSSIIPIVGAFVGAGIGSFFLLIEDPIQALYFLIIFIIIQQIEGNLIYPKVVGDSIGLPAMWVLAAVSIGGTLMGVAGILLCIPLASVAYALLREKVNARLENKSIVIQEE